MIEIIGDTVFKCDRGVRSIGEASMGEFDNVLDAMRGARFDEFCIRKASSSLKFSQGDRMDAPTYILETNCSISTSLTKSEDYEVTSPQSAKILYDLLESNLSELEKVSDKIFLARFEGGAVFYFSDFDNLWDNVFSVRVFNWPAVGDRGSYFF